MINVTGLWLNKDKNGRTYMSGTMGGARVLIFKNEKKQEGSKQPDYNLVFAENKLKEKISAPQTPDYETLNNNPFAGEGIPF